VCCGGVGGCGDVVNVIVESGEVAYPRVLAQRQELQTSQLGLDDSIPKHVYASVRIEGGFVKMYVYDRNEQMNAQTAFA